MKKFLLITLLNLTFYAQSQVLINSSHMPKSGDTMRYTLAVVDSAVLLNYANSGANQNWDFSNLVPQRQGLSEYLASSQTPYASSIPNRIGEKIADTVSLGGVNLVNLYNFYSSSSSEFALDYRGVSLPTGFPPPLPPTLQIAQSYSDKDEIYQFPLNYLDEDSSTFNFVFTNSLVGAYYSTSGSRKNTVDAWGTLSTPFGTFNCLRVVTEIRSYDSISFNGNNFGLNSIRREYKWLSPQFSIPAMTVSGPVVGGIFVPATAQYRDSVRDVPSLFSPIALFRTDTNAYYVGDTVDFQNLSISILPPSYLWNINPKTFRFVSPSSFSSDSIKVVFSDTGYYQVSLIAINSEGRDTLSIEDFLYISSTTSLDESQALKSLGIYPNPIQKGELLQLINENNTRIFAAKIYTLQGSLVDQIQLKNQGNLLKLDSKLSTGVYLLKLETEKGIKSFKLLVQE